MSTCQIERTESGQSLSPDDRAPDTGAYDEAVCAVVRETFAACGDEFLRVLVSRLAAALCVPYAFASGPLAVSSSEAAGERRLGLWLARDFGQRVQFSADGPPWRAALGGPLPVDYLDVFRGLFPREGRLDEIDDRSFRLVPLRGRAGRLLGHLGVLDPGPATDKGLIEAVLTTLATRAVAEIERSAAAGRHRLALARLRTALVGRRQRERLMTACAWCRRVRDERKDWQDMEGFLRARLGIELTHGICPDCLRRHQPGGTEPA